MDNPLDSASFVDTNPQPLTPIPASEASKEMPVEFKLPDLGEGVAEGEIVGWRVREGDSIAADQPLVEVMTDKVTVEIPSPVAGRVVKILAQEGDVIPVGTSMVLLEDGASPSASANGNRDDRREARDAGRPTEEKIRAVPFVRRLARELDVDLATVTGTGPAGRITEADVRAAAGQAVTPPPDTTRQLDSVPSEVPQEPVSLPTDATRPVDSPLPSRLPVSPSPRLPVSDAPPTGAEERVPFRGIRRRIAERLVQSLQSTAPFTFVEEVDMTQLVAVRERALPWAEKRGVKLTYLPFVIKALIAALREFPALNATVDEERGEIVLKRYYNIGIATHTDEGLIVPVIRGADQKSLWQLSGEIEALAMKARTGTLALEEIQDGTFTITSLGVLGGMMATPIINPPEVAILGIHQIRPQPVVREGQIVIRQMAHLSLTFDHRVIDGQVGAEFARAMISLLENPGLLMLAEEF